MPLKLLNAYGWPTPDDDDGIHWNIGMSSNNHFSTKRVSFGKISYSQSKISGLSGFGGVSIV